VLLAAASQTLPLPLRAAVALVGVGLVTVDGLQSEKTPRHHKVLLAVLTSLVVTGAMVGIDQAVTTPGVVAGATLVVWYGTRGVAENAAFTPRRWWSALEYLGVLAIALIGLHWVVR